MLRTLTQNQSSEYDEMQDVHCARIWPYTESVPSRCFFGTLIEVGLRSTGFVCHNNPLLIRL